MIAAGDLSSPPQGIAAPERTPPIKLAICVTFHYAEERLKYLAALSSRFGSLARAVMATIVTNTDAPEHHRRIAAVFQGDGVDFSIFTPTGLGHPYLLPWSHFVVMREHFEDDSFTHFLYLEDDLLCTQDHVNYLLEAREMLRPLGLIPGIFRVEQNPRDREWYCTDQLQPINIGSCPRVALAVETGLGFISLPELYQGMYFLDRELMAEHLNGPTSSPDFGQWPIREKAAQGLTFAQIPRGFHSRVVVPYYEKEKRLAQCCLLHHLTNSYALQPRSPNAKVRVRDIFL